LPAQINEMSDHPHHHWLCSLTGHRLANLQGERGQHAAINAVPMQKMDGTPSPYSLVVEKCTRCGRVFYGSFCSYERSHSLWG
jgi:hypothetical protein